MESHTKFHATVNDGSRIRVSLKNVSPAGVNLMFLSEDDHHRLEEEPDGGAVGVTHVHTVKPPSNAYLWTPPHAGRWWVFVENLKSDDFAVDLVPAYQGEGES